MKILYLCHRVPYPPNKGDKIRAFHQLRAISEHHEVDLFTLADDEDDIGHRSALEKYCRSVYISRIHRKWARMRVAPYLLSRKPLSIPYFYSSELAAEIQKQASRCHYDRVFVYCSAMGQYLNQSPANCPVIVDLVDVDSDKWLQYARFAPFPLSAVYRREGRSLRTYERSIAEHATCALVSTEREARLLRAIAPAALVEVVPNGVDTEYFSSTATPRAPGSPTIIFTGDMSYFPNIQAVRWFAEEVLPLISGAVPGVRFVIAGRNPGPAVRSLARQDGVEVTGSVPDIRKHLDRATVAVAPFQMSAGIPNKILEAMAYGLPVVATPCATRGLSGLTREVLGTAETPLDFAAMVSTFLRNPDAASVVGAESRRLVQREYSWEAALKRMLYLLEMPPRSFAQPPSTKEWLATELLP
jgi:polysaccharide biosynthesis protein PslH